MGKTTKIRIETMKTTYDFLKNYQWNLFILILNIILIIRVMETIGVMKVLQFQDASSNTSKNFFNRDFNKPTQSVKRFFIFGKNNKATSKIKKSPKNPIKVKRNVEDEIKFVVTSEFDMSNKNFVYADKEIDFDFVVKNDQRYNCIGENVKRFRPQSGNVPKNFMKNFKKKKYYDSNKIESEMNKYFDII